MSIQNIKLLGVPFDFGQDHEGVKCGPRFLRDLGLCEKLQSLAPLEDLGDLCFAPKSSALEEKIKYLDDASEGNKKISEVIGQMNLDQSFLLTIGGDHGMGLGSVHGILSQRPETIVVWADAHADINTPVTSPSGNFHGMPLSFLMNISKHPKFYWIENILRAQKLILIGQRDLDQGEIDLIKELNIKYFSSRDLNQLGAENLINQALSDLDPEGIMPLHLSFDVDVFDQKDLVSTGTAVKNGPRIEELFSMSELLAESGRLRSMDVVEFNPLIGTDYEARVSGSLIQDLIYQTIREIFNKNSHFNLSSFTTPNTDPLSLM